ncbi:hypothetical protein LPJ75_003889, partial [Coemansia sp. RSA 2598]
MPIIAKIPDVPGTQLPDADAELLKRVVEHLAGTGENMFPGSQPVSFTKSHSIPALQSADYL